MSEPVADVDVVILCGGLGTRLGSLLRDCPKPMVDINDRPFLDILIDYIASFGFKRFILCTGYKSKVIEDHYQKKDALTYIISPEEEPLGTAGALKNAAHLIKTDVFLGVNGDSFCQADLNKFIAFHFSKNAAILSMILASVNDASDYGSITLDQNQEIVQFNEKRSGSGYINAGIYAINKKVLEQIPPKQKWSLEYNVFPALVKQGLYGYVTEQKLFDIGTPERLEIAKKNL